MKTKVEIPLAIAKGVARMKEQSTPTEWKALHTATLVRYIAIDLLSEAKVGASAEQIKNFSAALKAVLEATPALVESSNLAKRLVDWEQLEVKAAVYE